MRRNQHWVLYVWNQLENAEDTTYSARLVRHFLGEPYQTHKEYLNQLIIDALRNPHRSPKLIKLAMDMEHVSRYAIDR